MKTIRIVALSIASLALGCKGGGESSSEQPNPTAKKASSAPAGASGTITGKITFEGTPPEMAEEPRFNPDGKPKDPACTTHEKYEYLQVKDGGVKDVVVRLAVGSAAKGPDTSRRPPAPTIDQKNCRYTPHVAVIQPGQKLTFTNSDDTLHNVHTYKDGETDFNIAQPKGSEPKPVDVPIPPGDQAYRVRCDVHPWMSAYVLPTDTPFFAVTTDNGSFKLDNVPFGTYKLEAWHPQLGAKTIDVTVEGGKTAEAKFPAFKAGDYKAPQ